MCYCYVRMSKRHIKRLNDRLLSVVWIKSRDEVESLLDLGAEVNACRRDVCY